MQLLLQNDDYKICEEFDNNGNRYFLCIPNGKFQEYQICCSLNEDNLTPGDMLLKASNIYANILKRNKQFVYAHMILDAGELTEAAHDNDNPLYSILLKKVSTTIKDTYQIIKYEKMAEINNKIGLISQNENDAKFIDWIEMNQTLPFTRITLSSKINHQVDMFDANLPFVDTSDGGGNTLNNGNTLLEADKPLTKTKKPAINSHGYGNIILVIITLTIALVVGIGIAYIMIKK